MLGISIKTVKSSKVVISWIKIKIMKNSILTILIILMGQIGFGQNTLMFKHLSLNGAIGEINTYNSKYFGCALESGLHFNLKSGREVSFNLGYSNGESNKYLFFYPNNTVEAFVVSYNNYLKLNKNKENYRLEHLLQIGGKFIFIQERLIEIIPPSKEKYFNYEEMEEKHRAIAVTLSYTIRRNFTDKFGISFTVGGDIFLGYAHSKIGIGIHFF